jgi:hypothetical protein
MLLRLFLSFSNPTESASKLILLILLVIIPAKGQEPMAAGRSYAMDASFGYAYARISVPGSGYVGMNGIVTTLTRDFRPRIAIKADLSYLRSREIFGSNRHNSALTYMGGPAFSVVRTRRTNVYLQGLIGGGTLSGENYNEYGGYLTGYVSRPAWSLGVGGERAITPDFSLRIGVDYLHAVFFNQAAAIKGTGNIRGTVSLVYSLERGHRK